MGPTRVVDLIRKVAVVWVRVEVKLRVNYFSILVVAAFLTFLIFTGSQAFAATAPPTPTPAPNPQTEAQQSACSAAGGTWKTFNNGCADTCGAALINSTGGLLLCTQSLVDSCDCGSTQCWNGTTCEANPNGYVDGFPGGVIRPTPTPTAETGPVTDCKGDINSDGNVNEDDVAILIANFFSTNPASDPNTDGIVDLTDYSILATEFGIDRCSL